VTLTNNLEIKGHVIKHYTLPVSTAQAYVVAEIFDITCKIV